MSVVDNIFPLLDNLIIGLALTAGAVVALLVKDSLDSGSRRR